MLELPDAVRLLNDLLPPVVILGVQLVSPEAELACGGTDDLLIINVQGDPVAVGKLLGQGFLIIPLYLLQVTGAVEGKPGILFYGKRYHHYSCPVPSFERFWSVRRICLSVSIISKQALYVKKNTNDAPCRGKKEREKDSRFPREQLNVGFPCVILMMG